MGLGFGAGTRKGDIGRDNHLEETEFIWSIRRPQDYCLDIPDIRVSTSYSDG